MALRTRIVLVVVALVAIALAVIEPVTYITTRQSLISKVDNQLSTSEHAVLQDLVDHPADSGAFGTIIPGTYAVLYSVNGQIPPEVGHNPGDSAKAVVPRSFVEAVAGSPNETLHGTFAGTGGVASYRALGTVVQQNNPFAAVPPGTYILVLALPLTGVQSTLAHVLLLEVLVGLLVLVAIAGGSWFLVQLSLRPLEQMARTASEIAAGDLTARIDDTDDRTEVGQLGSSLNTMLTKIEQAFRQKEGSEEQLRRFVADASHELRTPLTSIRGYAELFRNGLSERPQDLAVALRRIESESARMGVLVEDLLLLARLDQGRPLDNQPVDLTELAADAAGDAGVLDPTRAVTLLASGPCVVHGDDARLRQVLGNLLSNALAYSPAGSPLEVEVKMSNGASAASPPAGGSRPDPAGARPAKDSAGGRYGKEPAGGDPSRVPGALPPTVARIAVVDHGPGIPADDLAHIFDRFWRSDPSRVRSSGGTGLGLSIVEAVVSAHGGRVSVGATPGGGATFVVELPADSPAARSGVVPSAPDTGASSRPVVPHAGSAADPATATAAEAGQR